MTRLLERWRFFLERRRSQWRSLSTGRIAARWQRVRLRRWYDSLAHTPVESDVGETALRGWVPIQLDLATATVGWVPGASLRYRRGLFYETLLASLPARPKVPARRTGLATLRSAGTRAAREPTGFIFHVSRCGSTLLGNMLLASSRNLVIQEAEPVNAVLRDFDDRLPESEKIELLRGIAYSFDRSQPRAEGRLFVKFSSWNVLQLPLVRKAFPGVPWVFLYRDPIEVVVSNLLKPGTWVLDQADPEMGHHLAAASPDATHAMDRVDYCAHVVDRYCRAALRHADETALFVNYRQLSTECFRAILEFYGCETSEGEFRSMASQRSFYSKGSGPARQHREDRDRKQRLARADVRDVVTARARESFEALESRRITV